MAFNITCKTNNLSSHVKENVKDQLESSLKHLSLRYISAKVTFRDLNGPKGGTDKECLILIRPVGAREIVIKSRAEAFMQAFARGKGRLKNVLSKKEPGWQSG